MRPLDGSENDVLVTNWSHGVDECGDSGRSVGLLPRHDMSVNVERERDRRMAETFADNFNVHSRSE